MPALDPVKKNVAVLAILQALLLTNNSTAIALNGLVGYALASDKALATLPVTGWVIGAASTTFFASLLMKRIGRRAGFRVGTTVGICGASIASLAIYLGNFWLFCFGSMVFGVHNAFGQYYRFAAADAAPVDGKAKAISLVLAGGLVGGIIGPSTSRLTRDLLPVAYLGAYLALICFLFVVLFVLRYLELPPIHEDVHEEPARPLAAIVAQPTFIVAALCAAFGYGVMNFLMTATPLAMGMCGLPYAAAATVISWHVIGMYSPSFFTGSLIRRFGTLRIIFAGVLLNFLCVGVALSGVEMIHFWWALLLLGVGWNFLYIGGTTLLTEAYRPSERAKAQGVNDMFIFTTMATSSFSSGLLLNISGWQLLNHVALIFITVIGLAALYLHLSRVRQALRAAA
jgi:MFS family permease